jgi:uronate dehydrogenase
VERVLITGAAGRIGRTLRKGLRGRFRRLRLLDLAPLDPARPGEQVVDADVRDPDAVTDAMAGVDAVVHLAGIPREDTFDRILATNVVGTYNVLEAARRQGCRRVVLASSSHVTGFYDATERIGPEAPVRPDSFYGVSKACGENLGRLYADKHGLEVVCVRIGAFAERPTTPRHLHTWLSPRDAVELFYRCVVAPDVGFTLVYGASANQRGWWDPGPIDRLDYRPADDADRWASEVEAAAHDPAESGKGPQGGAYAR